MRNARKILAVLFLGFALASCVQDSFEEIELAPSEVEQQKATDGSDPVENGSIPPTEG